MLAHSTAMIECPVEPHECPSFTIVVNQLQQLSLQRFPLQLLAEVPRLAERDLDALGVHGFFENSSTLMIRTGMLPEAVLSIPPRARRLHTQGVRRIKHRGACTAYVLIHHPRCGSDRMMRKGVVAARRLARCFTQLDLQAQQVLERGPRSSD